MDEGRMTFTEHLGELRTRIIRSCIALVVGVIICFTFYEPIFGLLLHPLLPLTQTEESLADAPDEQTQETTEEPSKERPPNIIFLNPIEPFQVRLKLAAYGGVAVSLPYVIYQICAFLFPGLKPKERRAVLMLLSGCTILMVSGLSLAYFGVFPLVLPYLMQYAPQGVAASFRLNETVTLMIKGLLGFAIAFQFPMIVVILVYLELITTDQLRQWRRVAIVGLAFASAMFTPPDIWSMLLMMVPLLALYEVSIWVSHLLLWKKRRSQAKEERA